ncbi:Membrane protein YcjF [Marinobacterium lacunae]|uniref:Membrane protein YcjF n=1 Tax=Marinobacterium lacunae TaxID=1232683 RepID=A0A081FZV3_9GAMM|nr:TIGR01620 family protein [Marinobacterium lacunae]KEA64058.1 Membrane protein YcjF [Marinobacterium lacunae]MBR9883692.1 TIGR01620 family protein [Oceanospirillales bacterium]
MSEQPRYQKAVWVDPSQLDTADKAAENSMSAQEFSLQQITDVVEEPPAAVTTQRLARRKGRWRRVFGVSLTATLIGAVGVELYRLLDWSYTLHPAAGSVVSVLLVVLALSGAVQGWLALKGLRQLRNVERLQTQARELLQHKGQGHAAGLLKSLQAHYKESAARQPLEDAILQLDSAYSDEEVVRFLSRHALTEQDLRARRCVQRYSVESGVLVALSPWASFDMLLVGWRNLRMLREIAAIYGVAPGAAAQWTLLKRVMHNLAFAGLSEVAIDAGSAALGSSLTASLSARAGQGLGAGLFTARTGLQAMRLCRPLPSESHDQNLIKSIAGGIVERLGKSRPID